MPADQVHRELAKAAKLRDQPEPLVAALVDAWRVGRAPEIAALVEEAGRRVERPALPVKPADAAVKAWNACAKRGDAADVDRLCTAIAAGTVAQQIERLELLAKRPSDPRIARMALRILETQPVRSKGARGVYPAACALVVAMRDPRAAAIVGGIQMPGRGLEGGRDFQDYFARQIARLTTALAEVPPSVPLSAKSRALVAQIAATLAAAGRSEQAADANEDALLAAIWAAPDDDGARQVYADFLQQRGDPHGEFITLQLAAHRGTLDRAGMTRMRALQKAHARAFLGPLLPAITLTNLRFERGFVAHCELADKVSPEIAALQTHPAWATVRSFFAWTGRKIYPAMVKHLQKLGAKGYWERAPFVAKLPR